MSEREVKRFERAYRKISEVRSGRGDLWVVYETTGGHVDAMVADRWANGAPGDAREFAKEWRRREDVERRREDEKRFGVPTSVGRATRATRTQYTVGGARFSRSTRYRLGRTGSFNRPRLTDEDVAAIEAVVQGREAVDIVAERKAAAGGEG